MEISVLKQDGLSSISSNDGLIDKALEATYGIYFNDMRLLSRLNVTYEGYDMKLLSAQKDAYYKHSFYYTAENRLQLTKERIVGDIFAERYTLHNYEAETLALKVMVDTEADFFDIFEVRGGIKGVVKHIRKSEMTTGVHYDYKGLDGKDYNTYVQLSEKLEGDTFELRIKPQTSVSFELFVSTERVATNFDRVLGQLERQVSLFRENSIQVATDNKALNQIIETSLNDLQVLNTSIDGLNYYCAGVPYFMTLFGRDGLITGLFTSIVNADVIKSMLKLYARYQGEKVDIKMEEEPGKIVHEVRLSEMCTAGLSAFSQYYGTTDATLLYLILVIKYYEQTGDQATVLELKDNIIAAAQWALNYGTGDNGYIQYTKKSEEGNFVHGWRDSPTGVLNAKGEFPPYPHSLCEFQAYAYYAYSRLTDILDILGEKALDSRLQVTAEDLKTRFNRDFWMEDQKFFAQGLDGEGHQIDSISSDAGHLIFSGIIDEDKMDHVIDKLYSKNMFSGYGIRTFAKDSVMYNPMVYHGGTVWPHDTAMILMGMASEDEEKFNKIAEGLLSTADSLYQLPELFCGFDKEETSEVIPFPTACRPQAWSCAVPFILLEKMLGTQFGSQKIRIKPMKQGIFNACSIKNMPLGQGRIDFEVKDGQVEIVANTSGFEVELG